MVTISGTLKNASGTAELGSIVLKLRGYGQQVPRVSGSTLIANTAATPVAVGTDGTFSVPVYSNDQIVPPGTYYTVSVMDANGTVVQVQAYRFNAPQAAFDLNTFPPFDPTGGLVGTIPANQLVTVPWSPMPHFDGTAGLTFDFSLQSPVAASFVDNPVPGNLYTFIVTQAGQPGTFAWPATVNGGSPISSVPLSVTIQTFVCRADQTLDAIAPAMYYAGA